MPKWLRIAYLTALAFGPAEFVGRLLLFSPRLWLAAAVAALAAWATLRLRQARWAASLSPDESPPLEWAAANRREVAYRFLFLAPALIWAWLHFLRPPWSVRQAVIATIAGAVGVALAAAYLGERFAVVPRRFAWIVPAITGVLLGYVLGTIAESLYLAWRVPTPYRTDQWLVIAMAVSFAGFLGLLIDLRNRLWKWQATESRGWNVAVVWIFTVGVYFPPVVGAVLAYGVPKTEPFHLFVVIFLLMWAWIISWSAAALGFLIQLVRKRWLIGLTAGAASVQLGLWLFLGLGLYR